MAPTAAAACAARGEGGSPCGVILDQVPVRTSNTCTSLVAPAKRIPAAAATGPLHHKHSKTVAVQAAMARHPCQPAAGPGEPVGVPSGFFADEPSSAVAPPAGGKKQCDHISKFGLPAEWRGPSRSSACGPLQDFHAHQKAPALPC
jgi:hypothetical protein